jgi:hypothetical protein
MSARTIRLLARGSWAVAVLLGLATTLVLLLAGDVQPGQTAAFDVVLAVALLTYPTVGVVIASRRPGNAIGWLFCAVGVPYALAAFSYAYATYALLTAPGFPGGDIAAWLSAWVQFPPLFGAPALLFLLFPDGRLLGPRWRGAVWLTGVAMVGFAAAPALRPGPMPDAAVKGTVNPLGIDGAGAFLDTVGNAAGAAALLAIVLGTVSLALRFRRSRGTERLQLKWFVSAAVLFAVACLAGFLVFAQNDVLFGLVVISAFAAIPVAAGMAILRYRLYDIDVVINRALVYGALTATLAGAYLGSVLLLQVVLQPLTADSGLAIAASTLAVAALFRPARARIQAAVDRRFYRRRYDAARTLDAFGSRLRDELDLEALGADLRSVVRETVQPAHVSLWLRDGSR